MENENISTTERALTAISKVISAISAPYFVPFIAFVALFLFTYLSVMPYQYKLIVLCIVASFTIFLPIVMVFLFLKINHVPVMSLDERSRRYVPYILTIISFVFCSMMMFRLNIPWYMNGIILAYIMIMIVFVIANIKWKISFHAGAMGAVIGGIVSLETVFGYNPVWLLCVFIIVAGLVGTSRMILGKNTLNEVMAGFTIGLICTVAILHPGWQLLFQEFIILTI